MRADNELLTAAYAAFNRRDIDAVLELMSPDVDWPNGMEGGRVHGHREVRAYWTRQWAVVDPHVEPVRIERRSSGGARSFREDPAGPDGGARLYRTGQPYRAHGDSHTFAGVSTV